MGLRAGTDKCVRPDAKENGEIRTSQERFEMGTLATGPIMIGKLGAESKGQIRKILVCKEDPPALETTTCRCFRGCLL
jgi:hypothetical protein